MTPFLFAVASYALYEALRFVRAFARDHYPRQCSPVLYGLGLWAAYLLVAP